MEKILENTFRCVNIALANEMAVICHKMGIPVEGHRRRSHQTLRVYALYPGPGLGAYIYRPLYLSWKAKQYGCSAS